MSAELVEMMFDILEKRQGSEVFCTVWAKGKEYEKQGKLEKVDSRESVTIDGLEIPFDNGVMAISEIKLISDKKALNGKVIFANPGVIPAELANSHVQESEANAVSEQSVAEESKVEANLEQPTQPEEVKVQESEANVVSEQSVVEESKVDANLEQPTQPEEVKVQESEANAVSEQSVAEESKVEANLEQPTQPEEVKVQESEANVVSEQSVAEESKVDANLEQPTQPEKVNVQESEPAVKIVDFDALEARIGTHVSAKSWRYGAEIPYEGVLTEVVPNDRMTLGNNIISFVGENEAVEEIRDAGGNLLYSVPEAKGYTARDQMGLITAQLEMLGYSIKMEEMEGKGKSK